MDIFPAEHCSSGCESGWTLYLEKSFFSLEPPSHGEMNGEFVGERESEDDLSMVSDASSGPPHFQEHQDYGNDRNGFYQTNVNRSISPDIIGEKPRILGDNRRRKDEEQQEQPSDFLDDTASSSIFNFSDNNFTPGSNTENIMEYSQGYSATHFQEHFGFFESSPSGNQPQQNQWYQGKWIGG